MIPFGILSGKVRYNGHEDLEIRILDLSPEGFTFRLPHTFDLSHLHPETVILSFYKFQSASYHVLTLMDFTLMEETISRFYIEYRLMTDDTEYQKEVGQLTSEYLRYIRLRSEEEDAVLSHVLTGYPANQEGQYPESFLSQKARWFAPWSSVPTHSSDPWGSLDLDSCEMALSLDRPEMWNRYLKLSLKEFTRDFWSRNLLSAHPAAKKQVDCIYIGNQFCHLLFPEDSLLFSMLDKTIRDGVKAVLAFTYVQEYRLAHVDALLKKLSDWCGKNHQTLELVVNDWGMLSLIRSSGFSCFSLTLGVLLQKRRKDTRLPYKRGFDRYRDDLRETSLQTDFYLEYLRDHFHIQRISYESCGYPITLAPGRSALHFPFYQMNTSQYCPLYASCKNGDRGRQEPVTSCPYYCHDHVFLYPEMLSVIGRYNSLFGYDRAALEDGTPIRSFLEQGGDRIVAELL